MMQDTTSITANDRLTRLLTAGEISKILNISRSYAYKLIREGTITSIPIGRAVRVRDRDLLEFIDEKARTNQR